MCGIYGYVGEPIDVGSKIMSSLRTLEYRGYDSWGIAVASNGRVAYEKQPGRIVDATVSFPVSDIGFGHTRWATHGGVTRENAHPHLDCSGRLAIIHNGIVENFRSLHAELVERGHIFRSETDSEVIAHLLEEELPKTGGNLGLALARVFPQLFGLNAVIAMDVVARELVACKNVSPLSVGHNVNSCFIASDPMAMSGDVDSVHYLEDDQLVRLSPGGEYTIYDRTTMEKCPAKEVPLTTGFADAGLNGYPDFMSKEMAEQPAVLERLANKGTAEIQSMAKAIADSYGAFLVGCGTASYAALTGAYLFSRIARRHVNFVVGSEFKYHEHFLTPESLVIALSQSGETADIVEAMLSAKARGARLGALVNVSHSTLDRLVDVSVHLNAGPEQCVLSTKAYTAKVAALLLMAHELAGSLEQGRELVLKAAAGLRQMLSAEWTDCVRRAAIHIRQSDHLFVIGRGLSYATALEAALKIKEVSYIHAEGFAGGELKHGVIALIAPGTPCVVYAPCDETRADVLSGAMELKSRGAHIVGIGPAPDPVFDIYLPTPEVGDASPLVNALPAQMLGYHAALLRGNDPDKPRNLAKSVTVK